MENVFNRKLFQRKNKDAARDKLRSMGGIMASSEPLIREAMRTAENIPSPSIDIEGIMAAQKRKGPMPTAPLPQIVPGAPSMMAPPAQTPMPQPAQPAAPAQPAQPAAPASQPTMAMNMGGRPVDRPDLANYYGAASGPIPKVAMQPRVDVSQRAGSVVAPNEIDLSALTPEGAIKLSSAALSGQVPVNLTPFTEENTGSKKAAEKLNATSVSIAKVMRDANMSADEKSKLLISALGGNPSAEDKKAELSNLSEKNFGKKLDRGAKIDSLNQAITGFAVAAGTSPRATQNFARGMLTGATAMKATEEGREATDNAMKLAFAKAAGKSGGADSTYNKLYQKAIEKIMTRPDEFGIFVETETDADGNEIPGSGIDAASSQITTLADRIARAQTGGSGPGPSAPRPMTDIVTVTTQEDYDALAPGTPYIDSETGAQTTKRG